MLNPNNTRKLLRPQIAWTNPATITVLGDVQQHQQGYHSYHNSDLESCCESVNKSSNYNSVGECATTSIRLPFISQFGFRIWKRPIGQQHQYFLSRRKFIIARRRNLSSGKKIKTEKAIRESKSRSLPLRASCDLTFYWLVIHHGGDFFYLKDVSDDQRVKLTAIKLNKYTWISFNQQREREGCSKSKT